MAAEPTTPARRPNRTLAMVLLVISTLGTGAFMISSFLAFFQGDLSTGMWHFSLGTLWFLFFSWAGRVAVRPFPAQ